MSSLPLSPDADDEPVLEFDAIVGTSPPLQAAVNVARKVAASNGARSMLLVGEAGTGKELLARCIHYAGPDVSEPFVTISCSAVPEVLLEAELFGIAGSANARGDRAGIFELAGRGTVFLKDVGDLPTTLQASLRRVMEHRRVRRRGGLGEVAVTCRIIAATKAPLDERVALGSFDEALLAALSILRLDLPPLRDRGDDVILLARHLLAESARLHAGPIKWLTEDAVAALRAHRWPGNVRELKHVLERASVLADGPEIGADHLMIQTRRSQSAAMRGAAFAEIRIPPAGKSLGQIEREALEITLQLTNFNQSATARILGVSRPTLARKLKSYGLMPAPRVAQT
jgi:DNA-binding NtrC family response regulator